MEVSKVPQADPPAARVGTPAGPSSGSTAGTTTAETTATDTEYSSGAGVTAVADFADIRPLDLGAALQILVAEVQAGLNATLDSSIMPDVVPRVPVIPNGAAPNPMAQNSSAQTSNQAAHDLVDLFLRALPEHASDAPAWTAALILTETTVQSSIDRALGVIAAWRDIPLPVVDAVKETRVLFVEALADEPQSLLWLRPEWLGLAPLFQRFRRRRRNARRRLSDPDYPLVNLDQSEEFR
jgi:hypothetical protein